MKLSTNEEVTGISETPAGWRITTSRGNTFFSETVVNAAGTWAGKVMSEHLGMDIPITPKRGQILVTEASPAIGETNIWSSDYIVSKLHPELSTLDEKDRQLGLGMAITRTGDGNYFLGGTREFVGFDKGTTYDAFEAISKTAIDYFPILENLHIIRSFAGLRPASSDGKCIIGKMPGLHGFFMAAGHEGDGIALAPITGKFLTDLVMGRKTELDISELSPGRFPMT
jgi:sarcosine oxidase subunit beta